MILNEYIYDMILSSVYSSSLAKQTITHWQSWNISKLSNSRYLSAHA